MVAIEMLLNICAFFFSVTLGGGAIYMSVYVAIWLVRCAIALINRRPIPGFRRKKGKPS
jgi:hypothetical protein